MSHACSADILGSETRKTINARGLEREFSRSSRISKSTPIITTDGNRGNRRDLTHNRGRLAARGRSSNCRELRRGRPWIQLATVVVDPALGSRRGRIACEWPYGKRKGPGESQKFYPALAETQQQAGLAFLVNRRRGWLRSACPPQIAPVAADPCSAVALEWPCGDHRRRRPVFGWLRR